MSTQLAPAVLLAGQHALEGLTAIQTDIIRKAYYHVLQGTFGEPAVQKYRDEDVSQWRPEDLTGGRKKMEQ